MKRFLLVMVLTLLAGCNPVYWYGAAIGVPLVVALAHKEGDTIKVVSESSAAVTLEYTRSYSGEYPAAFKVAESLCQKYSRHARVASAPVTLSVDRSAATFDCVD